MRNVFILMAPLLVLALGNGPIRERIKERRAARRGETTEEGIVSRTIRHGGLEREYLVHVPASYSKGRAAPVVFAFHGGRSNAKQMVSFSNFGDLADQEGFFVVYPQAIEDNWNDGRGSDKIRSQKENIDDVGLTAAILAELGAEYNLDAKRIYATGISNGAMFSQYLASQRADLIAAIAPVAGGIPAPVAKNFKPSEPVSVLIFQGTDDPLMPYAGGAVAKGRGEIVSTELAVKKWVAFNECSGPKTEELPDRDPDDECRVKRDSYTGGRNGTDVIVYTVEGGGHTWPGGKQYLPKLFIGRVANDVSATRLIWEFFKKHPKS